MKKGVKKIRLIALGIFEKYIWMEPMGKELHVFNGKETLIFKWGNHSRTLAIFDSIIKSE